MSFSQNTDDQYNESLNRRKYLYNKFLKNNFSIQAENQNQENIRTFDI